MPEILTASSGLTLAVAAALGLVLGFLAGRYGGAAASRVRQLQAALTEERVAFDKLHGEYEGYRKRVADHFTQTSERLHDLTLQYRSVYEHLAKGASDLCPQGFSKLEGGLGLDALPEEAEDGAGTGAGSGDEATEGERESAAAPEKPPVSH
jgi:uncharacterized membrane-anchored protein YhcB (DUF1043 family)